MGVFDQYLNKKGNNGEVYRPTTLNFFIGSPEAESEATSTPITLNQFFEDYLDIFSQLNNEKFIVLGRKGSGKSDEENSPKVLLEKTFLRTDIGFSYSRAYVCFSPGRTKSVL